VQHDAPEIDKRSRPHLKACNDSWRVDETYIKVKKVWMYLYRAVDSEGNTLEFLLSSTRDAEAAKRFFLKALHSPAGSAPGAPPVEGQVEELTAATNLTTSALRVINVDKNAAYPKAMAELKASGVLPEAVELRQVKYLNNLVEQDHRFIIPISVLRDHSKMREVSHRTKTFWVGFQLIESFTHLIHHGIKRRKSEIRELLFASFLPHVFHRVELGTGGRLRDEPNIVRDLQVFGHMPTRLIDLHHHKVFLIGRRHMRKSTDPSSPYRQTEG
jgi:transposase-like protein